MQFVTRESAPGSTVANRPLARAARTHPAHSADAVRRIKSWVGARTLSLFGAGAGLNEALSHLESATARG